AVAVHSPDRRVENQFDVRDLLDAPDEVAGHALVQVVATDDQQHLAGMLSEKDGSLPGGVATTHEYHLGAPAQPRLVGRRSVVTSRALVTVAALDSEPAVFRPGGDEQALGRGRLAALEPQD